MTVFMRESLYFCFHYYLLPGIGDEETCEYFVSFEALRRHLSKSILPSLDLFYDSLGDWFNLADFPDSEEMLLDDEERRIFAGAIDEGEFDALRNVLVYRLGNLTPEKLQASAELFNYILDVGLIEYNARRTIDAVCWIVVSDTRGFAPWLLDRLHDQFCSLPQEIRDSNSVTVALRGLYWIIVSLRERIKAADWPATDVELGKFLALVDFLRGTFDSSSSERLPRATLTRRHKVVQQPMSEMERLCAAAKAAKMLVDSLPQEIVDKLGYGQLVSDLEHEFLLSGIPTEERMQEIRAEMLGRWNTQRSDMP
jgi:hypothetical protein